MCEGSLLCASLRMSSSSGLMWSLRPMSSPSGLGWSLKPMFPYWFSVSAISPLMIKYAIFINVLLLLDRPLYHCTMMTFCVTSLSLCLKVCFAWCKYSYPNFLLVSICIENLFPFLPFQSLCVLTSKVRIDGLPPAPIQPLYAFRLGNLSFYI